MEQLQQRYCQQIDEMHEKLHEKEPALVNRRGRLLLYDNTRPHVSQMTQQKLKQLNIEVLPHPPYSSDLSPTVYLLSSILTTFSLVKPFRPLLISLNPEHQIFIVTA